MKRYLSGILAVAVAVGSIAFTKTSPAFADYFVASQDATYYYVTTTPASCLVAGANPCKIQSSMAPDQLNRIRKTQATVIGWKN